MLCALVTTTIALQRRAAGTNVDVGYFFGGVGPECFIAPPVNKHFLPCHPVDNGDIRIRWLQAPPATIAPDAEFVASWGVNVSAAFVSTYGTAVRHANLHACSGLGAPDFGLADCNPFGSDSARFITTRNPGMSTSIEPYKEEVFTQTFKGGLSFVGSFRQSIVLGHIMVLNLSVALPAFVEVGCASGSFAQLNGTSSNCVECSPGTYRNANLTAPTAATACTACAPGYFQAAFGATECTLCSCGRVSAAGATTCAAQCPLGNYGVRVGAVTTCAECPIGSQCYDGVRFECAAGTYQDEVGQGSCKSCAAGYFGEAAGLNRSSCTGLCPAGFFCPGNTKTPIACPAAAICTPGSTTPRVVVPCVPGQFTSDAAAAAAHNVLACNKCPAGKYSDAINANKCKSCAEGTYQDAAEQPACEKHKSCPAGQRVLEDGNATSDRVCVPCDVHTFSDTSNQVRCKPCPANELQPLRDQIRCVSASKDEFVVAHSENVRSLEACPATVNLEAPEVACGDGELQFRDDTWHDGLRRTDAAGTRFSSPLGRRPLEYNPAMRFYRCPGMGACTYPDNRTGELVCTHPTAGPLCAVCLPGYAATRRGKCEKCPVRVHWPLIAPALFILVAGMAMWWWCVRRRARARDGAGGASDVLDALIRRLRPILKQGVSFYQCVSFFGDVYDVQYPARYRHMLAWLAIFKLNFGHIFRLGCIDGYSWHWTFYTSAALFVTVTALQFVLLLTMEARRTTGHEIRPALQRWSSAVTLISYATYPSFSASMFQSFNCHSVDGVRYLRADYSIDCDSAAHQIVQWVATGVIVGCALGIPVLYVIVLFRASRHGAEAKTCASTAHLHFFVQDYEPEYWYWEATELMRKLILTGLAALWAPGTLMQLITSMLITLGYVIAVALCKPFTGQPMKGGDEAGRAKNAWVVNFYALSCIVLTFLALFGALLNKIGTSFVSTGAVSQGYDHHTLEIFLMCITAVVALAGLTTVIVELGIAGLCGLVGRFASHKWQPSLDEPGGPRDQQNTKQQGQLGSAVAEPNSNKSAKVTGDHGSPDLISTVGGEGGEGELAAPAHVHMSIPPDARVHV